MDNVIRIAKRLIPIEQIALFEPFVAPADPPLRSTKEFKSRIVLLNRSSVLAEETPEQLVESNKFRFVPADRVGTNPSVSFSVEDFEPAEGFQPVKPFKSRLLWNDEQGKTRSKLLLATAEEALAIVVRGDDFGFRSSRPAPRRRRANRSRGFIPSRDVS